MEKFLRYFATIATVGIILAVYFMPKAEADATRDGEPDWQRLMLRLNEDLPRAIGSIGFLERIAKEETDIHYFMSVKGDPQIIDFYEENHEDFTTLLMYALMQMNGQKGMGDSLSVVMNRYDLGVNVSIRCGSDSVHWHIDKNQFARFLDEQRTSPTDAFMKILDMHIKLGSLELPTVVDESQTFTDIIRNEDKITYVFNADETEYDIDYMNENKADSVYIETLAEAMATDADAKEVMRLMVIAHADMALRYEGRKTKKTATVDIPYSFLKRHCDMPENLIKW